MGFNFLGEITCESEQGWMQVLKGGWGGREGRRMAELVGEG